MQYSVLAYVISFVSTVHAEDNALQRTVRSLLESSTECKHVHAGDKTLTIIIERSELLVTTMAEHVD
jgi:hypothetical protein